MKLATLFALFASASAFAPLQQTSKSSTTTTTSLAAWRDEVVVGITPPVGFWDPLGLSKGQPDKVMNYYRESEL
jgi:hypothetical protein